ncbi:MAG: response regulator transcription factor [Clostridium sp.]|uniref:LytR/AlgR family response regulator transcription factor n=1 Tax=Clostridium sp. TaxID=1506 RepID=UPI0025BEB318|nr:LytTR family DNA-binding domain-containing protein [Clostridium sp.]MCF0148274.1 response regulator transcription factor [Clostridium sp.]
MFKIALVENEKIHMKVNRCHVEMWSKENNIPISIKEFNTPEEFIFKSFGKETFDLILLDIKFKGLSGIELAKLIRENDTEVGIIFVTSSLEYSLEGYQVNATNYLIKPINKENLYTSLNTAFNNFKMYKKIANSILIKESENIVRLNLNDIIYCESSEHYVYMHTKKKFYKIKKKISDLEKEIKKSYFVRCHRSFIVNINFIKSICNQNVILTNDTIIPISKSKRTCFKKLYFKCF